MSVLYLLVPIALVLVGIALGAYVWAVKRGQFDDLTTPAMRAIHDDAPPIARRKPEGESPTDQAP
jgi:cbb3-type cytochrome oxidase maturation protein